MKKIITFLLLLFVAFANAQQIEHISLRWQDIETEVTAKNMNVGYIFFEDAVMEGRYGSLPVFTYNKHLPDKVFTYEAEIENPIYDTLSLQNSLLISDADLLTNEFEIWVSKNSLETKIKVLPIKMDLLSGRIIILREFNLIINLVPDEIKQNPAQEAHQYAENSVLSQGTWYKMGIVNTGIHKLDWNFLNDMGITPSEIDVEKIGVFSNYSGMLPEDNGDENIDDLQENAIELVGMDDGSFDKNDYILFYANNQEKWRYNPFAGRFIHSKNLYADTVFCFFTPDAGNKKQITTEESLSVQPTIIVTDFIDYLAHENDFENLMFTGKEWFGERLTMAEPELEFTHNIPNLMINKPIYLQFKLISRAFENSSYEVFVNDILVIDSTRINKVNPASEAIYAKSSTRTETFFSHDEDILTVKVVYNTSLTSSVAWIDYFVLNFERELIFENGQMGFRRPDAAALGNKSKFEIRNPNGKTVHVWDVTDEHNILNIGFNSAENLIDFTLATDSLREFIVFEDKDLFQPVSYENIENQNLHAVNSIDFIIVSPDIFLAQAERLAQIHTEKDSLNTLVVSPGSIYNEFSSGSQDIGAIRNFMRMLYKKDAFKNGPGYLLMFGDGSFDYKHRVHENTNFVPTYESQESLKATLSYVTDDFFGLLDDDEGAFCTGELDIGIGRFPIKDIEEATTAVDKVEDYLTRDIDAINDWTKSLCFVADDGDNNLHFKQADQQLVTIADTLNPGFDIKKIYSDSYKKVEVPGGFRFPEVNNKLNEQVGEGALIINYTGHGGLIGWSEELILDVPMINSFDNLDNLPLFITATCEFSRFDNPEFTSAGEYVFLNEKGGGIALLTTTRLAYAHANIIVNKRIYTDLLKREDGSIPRLGDIIRMAKNPSSSNFLNFTLLGDPALRLAFPDKNINTLSINDKSASAQADTINALTHVEIKGRIENTNGSIDEGFNGFIYPVVFDKASQYSTLGTASGSYPAKFELMDKVLYRGKSTVVNGEFSFSFLVPKDITFNYGFGKISYYAFDTINYDDAWGGFTNFVIGGLNEDAEIDETGPEISLFINDYSFENGAAVENEISLLANFFDESGIHSTGSSLGRDIVATLDDNYLNKMVLNTYYNSDVDTYQKGSLSFDMGELEPGLHTLSVKAWDLLNNSSTKTIEFVVKAKSDKGINEVYNYPNPFYNRTIFNFNSEVRVQKLIVEIFSIAGQHIVTLKDESLSARDYLPGIVWNGLDNNGNMVPGGVYLYNIYITNELGETSVLQQKMIKLTN